MEDAIGMDEHRSTAGLGGVGSPQAALLTPVGRGALAVIAVRGAGARVLVGRFFTPRRGRPVSHDAAGTIRFGRWQHRAGDPGEDVVVSVLAAAELEVHCHGGLAAAEAILASLVAAGAVRLSWEEWIATKGDAEWAIAARVALAAVEGVQPARILTRQLAGAWDAQWSRLTALVATGSAGAVRAEAARLLAAARVGLRLGNPWRVVLAGPVNAGKSSLVNALAGHARSIVTPTPGTTRDLVETRLVLGGWELVLVDTAGLRAADAVVDPVERAGMARAVAAAGTADLVLRVVPADAPSPPPAPGPNDLLVCSKCDLQADPAAVPWSAGGFGGTHPVATSAATGAGIDRLVAAIVARLVPEEHDDPGLLAGAVPVTPGQVDAVRRLLRSLDAAG